MKKPATAVTAITAVMVGAALGAAAVSRQCAEEKGKWRAMSDKHLTLYLMMNQWVRAKQEGKSVAEYLEKKGIHSIAIYGMNYVGETLLKELKGSAVEAVYAIDQNADSICSNVEVVAPDGVLQPVDAVIVTPVTYFDEIETMLSKKVDGLILSMEEILYDI